MAAAVAQDEVTLPRIVPGHFLKPTVLEQGTHSRHVLVLDGDIEIGMTPRLLAELRVDRPSPVDVEQDVILIQEAGQIDHIARGHLRAAVSRPVRQVLEGHRAEAAWPRAR
jgi:hypothetical protein